MATMLSIGSWMEVIGEVTREIASTALNFESPQVELAGGLIQSGMIGAYLPISTPDRQMQVGLLSTESGCQVLGKALLGMEPGEPDLDAPDLADAISEIVNVLAGAIKRKVHGQVDLKLGLPLFVNGSVQPTAHVHFFTATLHLGSTEALVLLAEPTSASEPRMNPRESAKRVVQ